jgi:hypothetical protein
MFFTSKKGNILLLQKFPNKKMAEPVGSDALSEAEAEFLGVVP